MPRHQNRHIDVIDDSPFFVRPFPIFVKDHSDKPKTLYELETVKVPTTR